MDRFAAPKQKRLAHVKLPQRHSGISSNLDTQDIPLTFEQSTTTETCYSDWQDTLLPILSSTSL